MKLGWIQSLILAVLRGLSGILPLSDSGLQTIARNLLGLPLDGSRDGFLDGLCILAVSAVIAGVYRRELRECFLRPSGRRATERERLGQRQWTLLICSFLFSLPGLLFGWNPAYGSNRAWVACLLIVNGLVLFVGDRMSRGSRNLPTATLGDAVSVGLAQSLSVIPGFSRMGFTMTFGIFRGLDPMYCFRFSMLSAIPFYLVRGLVMVISSEKPESGLWICFLGMVICGGVAYLALRLLRLAIRKNATGHFAFISWGAALLLLMLYLIS